MTVHRKKHEIKTYDYNKERISNNLYYLKIYQFNIFKLNFHYNFFFLIL